MQSLTVRRSRSLRQNPARASASEKGNKSIEAVVKLVMDKVIGFNGEGDTGLTLRITSEDTEGYVITNPLSNKPVQENGHRESTDIPDLYDKKQRPWRR